MAYSHFKKKLFFLALFPLLGIIIFSFISINQALKTVKQGERLIDIVRLTFINNALVHEIQKERGMSNVFYYSRGQDFYNELRAQRKASDLIFLKREAYLIKLDKSQIQSIEETKLRGIDSLEYVRSSVDTFSTTPASIIDYYSTLNNQLINTIFTARSLAQSANINNLLHAYYNLVSSKEFAGIERALLADISNVDGLNTSKMSVIIQVRAKEEVHLALFYKLATKELKQFYEQSITHDSIDKMTRLRRNNAKEITSKTWFSDASQRINQLQKVEKAVTKSLLIKLKKLTLEVKNQLIFSSAYGVVSITLTLLLFLRVMVQITDERKYKQRLIEQKEELNQFKVIVDNTLNSVVITDSKGIIEYVNKRFTEISGFEAKTVIGGKPKLWSSGETSPEVYAKLRQTLNEGDYWQGELKNKKQSGGMYWARTTIFPVKSPQNRILKYICVQEDITQQQHDKETIEHLVNHDPLTGLPSLRLGKDRLEQAILSAQRHKLTAAVMFIDLDGFKEINDEFGHAAGDNVLIEVGQRMIKELRKTDTVARIGGDEFIVVMTNIKDVNAISQVAIKIINSVKNAIPYQDTQLHVTASIGIAKYPLHGTTSTELMTNADKAMYRIKESGKNSYAIFSD
jgi:diguanylate cyclase (GGDEF)-like protein/PAS domain S-box-containing protein